MTFGQKLRKLRSEAGMTQKELAEKLSVTFQTVSKWESDVNEPDIASIKQLAKVFDCSVESLFFEEDSAKAPKENGIMAIAAPIKDTKNTPPGNLKGRYPFERRV